MKCIDFDKQFERYTRDWMAKNAEKYNNDMDAIEAMMPDIYMEFMSKPAAWLDGMSPEAYFEQYDDAGMLIDWMCAYYEQGVPVPDLLLERITALDSEAEEKLLALPFGENVPHEAALTAYREQLLPYLCVTPCRLLENERQSSVVPWVELQNAVQQYMDGMTDIRSCVQRLNAIVRTQILEN